MGEALFHDPEVRKVIRAILVSKGIRGEEDLEDAVGAVVLRCIERVRETGEAPEVVDEAIPLARKITQDLGVDEVRTRVRHGKKNIGPTPDADKHPREPGRTVDSIDAKRILEPVEKALTPEQRQGIIDRASGVPHKDIADSRGISPAAQRKRFEADRKRAWDAVPPQYKAIILAGGFAALVGGTMFALHRGPWGDSGDVTNSPFRYAAEQRRIAAQECRERKWDECKKALDRAADADPEGEGAAEVKALREAIAAAKGSVGAGDGGGR
jgi:hypothetical protein